MIRTSLGALALAAALLAGTSGASAQIAAVQAIAPPALVAPLLTAQPPALFQWTPVAPVNAYRLHVQNGRRMVTATTLVAVSYEVQISDRPDVGSHVLYDKFADSTTLLFENRNVEGSGFTDLQPPGMPLPGGAYYWRVRALFGGPATPYSSIGRFTLAGGGITSTPFHDLGVTGIALGANAVTGVSDAVVVHVANVGTFPEQGAGLDIAANGEVIGRAAVPMLLPGRAVDVSVVWTPRDGGLAQLTAQLRYDDQNAINNQTSQTTFVATKAPVATTIVGTLVRRDAAFALADAAGRPIAAILPAPGAAPFAALVGKRVTVSGTLAARGGELLMTARAVRPL